MNVSPLRCTLGLVAAFLFADAAAAQVTIADDLYPGAVVGRGDYLVRLVDDLDGEPIAGAEVFLVAESQHPIGGEFWFSHRGVSDAEGFVRIPQPKLVRDWHWQVMKHPVRGVAARSDYVEPIWRIGRTFDVPLEIQDWAGRPAGGARVGFCGGCGHSPDIADATAAANGFVVLRGIDPQQDIRDLYVQHPGLRLYYDSVRWRPGEPPMVVRCGYGPELSGTVVDFHGTPVAGAYVRGGGFHRGPWGKTAADGTFTILGCDPGDCPYQVVLPDGREVYFPNSRRYPVTLRLNDPADGDNEGTIEQPAEPEVPPPALRRLAVEVEGPPSAETSLEVYYPGVPDGAGAPDHVMVPSEGPFVLTVRDEGGGGKRRFSFADSAMVADPLVVRWIPDVRVVGRAVDASGQALAVRARWRRHWSETGDAGKWTARPEGIDIPADEAGWALLEVQPQDAIDGRRLLWVLLPEPGQQERVELGTVVVGEPARLHVVDADGSPLPGAIVALARPGWQEVDEEMPWSLAADGGWLGPDLRAGDTIVVRRDEQAVPFRRALTGDGPWRIEVPAGRLELDIVAAGGAPLDAVVLFADHYEEVRRGHVALHGLPHGALRLYVSAPGHRSAIVDADVSAAGGSVRVELPVR
jgi:hypothetical protein